MSETIQYDRMTIITMKLGTALLRALSEHGLSEGFDGGGRRYEHNSFSFSELVGRADAMLAGKAVRKMWTPFCMNFESRLPAEFRGVSVHLSGGRLHLVRS